MSRREYDLSFMDLEQIFTYGLDRMVLIGLKSGRTFEGKIVKEILDQLTPIGVHIKINEYEVVRLPVTSIEYLIILEE